MSATKIDESTANLLNGCTQTVICFFTAKYEILQLYLHSHSFFYSEMQNFENCTQTATRFSQRNKKFRIVHKLPFIPWLQNTKFLKFFRNSHLLFGNKLKNLKFHPNCHLFFDHEMQNLKSYLNGHSFFTKNNKNRTLALVLLP